MKGKQRSCLCVFVFAYTKTMFSHEAEGARWPGG